MHIAATLSLLWPVFPHHLGLLGGYLSLSLARWVFLSHINLHINCCLMPRPLHATRTLFLTWLSHDSSIRLACFTLSLLLSVLSDSRQVDFLRDHWLWWFFHCFRQGTLSVGYLIWAWLGLFKGVLRDTGMEEEVYKVAFKWAFLGGSDNYIWVLDGQVEFLNTFREVSFPGVWDSGGDSGLFCDFSLFLVRIVGVAILTCDWRCSIESFPCIEG